MVLHDFAKRGQIPEFCQNVSFLKASKFSSSLVHASFVSCFAVVFKTLENIPLVSLFLIEVGNTKIMERPHKSTNRLMLATASIHPSSQATGWYINANHVGVLRVRCHARCWKSSHPRRPSWILPMSQQRLWWCHLCRWWCSTIRCERWWFQRLFYVHPYLGRSSNLTDGWLNHQLEVWLSPIVFFKYFLVLGHEECSFWSLTLFAFYFVC